MLASTIRALRRQVAHRKVRWLKAVAATEAMARVSVVNVSAVRGVTGKVHAVRAKMATKKQCLFSARPWRWRARLVGRSSEAMICLSCTRCWQMPVLVRVGTWRS